MAANTGSYQVSKPMHFLTAGRGSQIVFQHESKKISVGDFTICKLYAILLSVPMPNGLVAQLGERRVRNAEVMGSSPTRSTNEGVSEHLTLYVCSTMFVWILPISVIV